MVAQRAHQPHRRRRARPSPRPAVRVHRAGHRLGARLPRSLDYFFDRMRNAVGSQEREWGLPVVEKMALQPSEYWARQCHVGASFIRPSEVPIREQVGVDRIMWGSDYPHKESSHPFSKDAIRLSFAGVDPTEVQMMLAGNAAELYRFDLDALAPSVPGSDRRRGGRPAAVAGRLPGRFTEVPGVRGSPARHALTIPTPGGTACRSTSAHAWTVRWKRSRRRAASGRCSRRRSSSTPISCATRCRVRARTARARRRR